MRLPRFRVRTLMAIVGVVALLLWGSMMGVRSYNYYRLATTYAAYERGWRELAARGRIDPTRSRSVGTVYGEPIADYYAPLARKYRQAVWRPWTPVAPDPPAPVFR